MPFHYFSYTSFILWKIDLAKSPMEGGPWGSIGCSIFIRNFNYLEKNSLN